MQRLPSWECVHVRVRWSRTLHRHDRGRRPEVHVGRRRGAVPRPARAVRRERSQRYRHDLCDEPVAVPPEALGAFAALNLYLDTLEGLPGPITGTITEIEGVFVVSVDPPAEEEEEPPADSPPVIPDPVIDATPWTFRIQLEHLGCDGSATRSSCPRTQRSNVTFILQVTDTSGGTFWIVFTDLPSSLFGTIFDSNNDPVDLVTEYDPVTEVFNFRPVENEPDCASASFTDCFNDGDYPTTVTPGPVSGSVQWSDSFAFRAENSLGGQTDSGDIDLVAVDDICTTNTEGHDWDAIEAVCPSD